MGPHDALRLGYVDSQGSGSCEPQREIAVGRLKGLRNPPFQRLFIDIEGLGIVRGPLDDFGDALHGRESLTRKLRL